MANVSIAVRNQNGGVKASVLGEDQAILVFEGEYEEGDTIVFTTDKPGAHYVVRVDDCMDESFVYLTKTEVVYTIPFGEKKISYNPQAFTGERHYLTIREAFDHEAGIYRNLAKNVMDQHGDTGCFPHAFATWKPEGKRCLRHAMPLTAFSPTNPTEHGPMSHGESTVRMMRK
uniref:hypothetical protein n=1 Tax=Clostridium sp. NkU-1 TaxID=1095009 RepID=UPI000A6868F0